MIVSNTSPLIYLAKIGKLELLKSLFKEIIIPRQVYDEIMKGKEENYLDALFIESAVKDGWIIINETIIEKEFKNFSRELDLGELALLSLSIKLKPSLILIDDASARMIAESKGFNAKGTLYVLLKAYKEKIISKQEIKKCVNELVFSGFRISQEIYLKFLEEIDKS